MTATLPDIMAAVLKEGNCSLPLSLTASVNRNGAVTLTANPYTRSSAYPPFFDAKTKKLNERFPVGDNPFQVFREAPTSVELLIHHLPLSILPDELLTSSLHSLNQSAMRLTSPFLGLDSCSQTRRKGLRSAQPQGLWLSTQFMFPGAANRCDISPVPIRSLLPTLPPSPRSAVSAGVLVTLPLYAMYNHNLARSAHSSMTVLPTDVLTKAVRKEALRSLWWDAAMPPLLSESTVVVSTPPWMAPVPAPAKSSPLSVPLGTKTFLMPPLRDSLKPPLRVQLLPQLYRLL